MRNGRILCANRGTSRISTIQLTSVNGLTFELMFVCVPFGAREHTETTKELIMHARISALVLALVLACTGLASAQRTTGTISGRIVDAQGLAVPGASVTVTGPQGARTTVTETTGRFTVPFLTPGTYSVKAELRGFKSFEQRDIVVRLEQTVDLPITMQVGGLAETLDVTGTSPAVDTQTTTAGANLDSAMLSRLPVGRSLAETL